MSIDDDYFDLEDAIKAGEVPEDLVKPMERILEALSDQEKLTMALQDRNAELERQSNDELWDKAEATHEIKRLKAVVKRLKKAS